MHFNFISRNGNSRLSFKANIINDNKGTYETQGLLKKNPIINDPFLFDKVHGFSKYDYK